MRKRDSQTTWRAILKGARAGLPSAVGLLAARVRPLCKTDTDELEEWLTGIIILGYENAQHIAEDWDAGSLLADMVQL